MYLDTLLTSTSMALSIPLIVLINSLFEEREYRCRHRRHIGHYSSLDIVCQSLVYLNLYFGG